MKRAASQNGSAADSRRAADRLRQANDALGGMQKQDAAGRLGSMSQTAEQLAARQKQQADKARELISQQKQPTAQEMNKMVSDRQQVADDLARLTQQVRNAARELAPTQPAATGKLRSALEGVDENDLNNRMQRSSDWLRTGDFSDPAETALTSDLQKLGKQLGDAAHALGTGERASGDTAINRAMDDLSKLRDQLAGMGRAGGNQPGQGQGQRGQQGQPNRSTDQLSRAGQPGQQGQQGQGQQGQGQGRGGQGQQAQNGQGQGQAQGQGNGGQQRGGNGGQNGGDRSGPIGDRVAGGGARGTDRGSVYGDFDTGNTTITGHAVQPQKGPNPADAQREIEQGLNLLNQVRGAVQDSPEAKQQLQSLIDQMRNLDPKRFPGNPALVEQMRQQLVSNVDALELQLRRQLDEKSGGTIRNADPSKVPAGYQAAVAEYYRKLSGGH